MSKENHGKCVAVYKLYNENTGFQICIGVNPYPEEDVPAEDKVRICRIWDDRENKQVDFLNAKESRELGMSLINASFLSTFDLLSDVQREFITKYLKDCKTPTQ